MGQNDDTPGSRKCDSNVPRQTKEENVQNNPLMGLNNYEVTRLIDQPWRGAEACHFLLLSQHQLYTGRYEQALRTALLLRDYEDIFDARKIHSIIGMP